jgi:hypothetical protein
MKKFLFKLGLFSLLILSVQMFLPASKNIPNEIKLLDAFMKLKCDIIYFGDSTINWAAKSDVNEESMPGLLQRLLPESRIAKITHASYQMDVYEAYAKYIVRKNYRPKVVIIPINLRSFSVEWDKQPIWQFEKEKLTLAMKDTFWMKFYKPLAVFKYFDPAITRFEYEKSSVFDGEKFVGKARDFDNADFKIFSEQNLKKKLTFRYMYPLTAEHRKIKSLGHTAQLLKGQGIQPIFYITPVDWQTIEKYLGANALERMTQQKDVIKNTLAAQGVVLLDLSRGLPTGDFSWPEDGQGPYYPNEHLKLRGRMFVVKSLVDQTGLKSFEKM